jgi:hypothetical protein
MDEPNSTCCERVSYRLLETHAACTKSRDEPHFGADSQPRQAKRQGHLIASAADEVDGAPGSLSLCHVKQPQCF